MTGYKVNVQKSLALLCTNDEKSEREIKETLSFTIATKRVTYLRVNLPKRQNTCVKKTMTHGGKKIKVTQRDGDIDHVFGLVETTLQK